MLRFPIHKLDVAKKKTREKRLVIYNDELNKQKKEILEFFKRKTGFVHLRDVLKYCTPYEDIQHSFKQYSNRNDSVNTELEATYSFNSESSTFNECKTYNSGNEIVKDLKQTAREQFDMKKMEKRNCLYDTPGIILNKQLT